MASFRDTMKLALFTYPDLYPNPANVAVSFFCQSSDSWARWNDAGELVLQKDWDRTTMEYLPPRASNPYPGMEAKLGHVLRDEAQNYRRRWMEENIERVLDASCTNVYFGADPRSRGFVRDISKEFTGNACAFTFPDNIAKDWAEALWNFLQYWLVRINCEYDIDHTGKLYAPEKVKDVVVLIKAAQERLHPLVFNGQTQAQANIALSKFINKAKGK
jgi:hypothetical protein